MFINRGRGHPLVLGCLLCLDEASRDYGFLHRLDVPSSGLIAAFPDLWVLPNPLHGRRPPTAIATTSLWRLKALSFIEFGSW